MSSGNLKDGTILLVEDNSNDIIFMERACDRANLTNSLQIVTDGESAIDYLIGKGTYTDRSFYPLPALILLDLKLPRLSGLEVLEWLQQQPKLRRLPVVVLTTSREISDVNSAYSLGANSYLVKPVLPDDLVEMVKMLNTYWLGLNERPQIGSA